MRVNSKLKSVEQSNKPIRILLVTDRALVRTGLRMLIESHSGLTVIGEASNRSGALEALGSARQQPDVVLFDLGSNGDMTLDFLPDLSLAAKEVPVLIVSDLYNPDTQRRAIRLGAMGIIFKQNPPEVLIKAIEKVHAGEVWFGRSVVASVLREIWQNSETDKAGSEAAKMATLTEREREVVDLICLGLRNRQVAEHLCISEATVRHHLTSIFDKLGVADRFELALYAYRNGFAALPHSIPEGHRDRRAGLSSRI
ncbi:MAG TPA: response regulator transcription factor [Acidobacteriota bacterium]